MATYELSDEDRDLLLEMLLNSTIKGASAPKVTRLLGILQPPNKKEGANAV